MSEITNEIFKQLGGQRFVVFTGCKNFVSDSRTETLRMTLPRNQSKANRLEISYDFGKDAYKVRFYKYYSGRTIIDFDKQIFKQIPEKVTEIKQFDCVYCDQLLDIFCEVTGLYVPYRIVFG